MGAQMRALWTPEVTKMSLRAILGFQLIRNTEKKLNEETTLLTKSRNKMEHK